jgi:hypothetical protein
MPHASSEAAGRRAGDAIEHHERAGFTRRARSTGWQTAIDVSACTKLTTRGRARSHRLPCRPRRCPARSHAVMHRRAAPPRPCARRHGYTPTTASPGSSRFTARLHACAAGRGGVGELFAVPNSRRSAACTRSNSAGRVELPDGAAPSRAARADTRSRVPVQEQASRQASRHPRFYPQARDRGVISAQCR